MSEIQENHMTIPSNKEPKMVRRDTNEQQIVPITDKQMQALEEVNLQDTVQLDFSDVTLDIKLKGTTKRLLNNVSGFVKPGEILYIMGPSGAGKTTLLDFLTDRTHMSPSENVYLNKKHWTQKEFKKVARYCQQHPQLYECLTVFETLYYAAQFFTKTRQETLSRVNKVIEMLGLEGQRNTKVGGLFYRGISGGQKQRVSVGEQLVANPKILFLDEPTSGLDSAAAYQLMSKLKNIAQLTKLTVVASIHQPSQRVFDISDRLLLLAGGKSAGKVAYFGESEKCQEYFNSINMVNKGTSALGEWILDEVNGDFGDEKTISQTIESYNNSQNCSDCQRQTEYTKQQDFIEKYKFEGVNTKQNWFLDVMVLTGRGIKNNLKNPLVIWIRVAMYCAMALVLGTIWIGIGDGLKAGDVQNMAGVLFFMAAFLAFMQVSIIPTYLEDKLIMIKEKNNGCYSLSAYFTSHFLVQTPFTFMLALAAGTITFFFVQHYNGDSGLPYVIFILNLFITLVTAEGLILLVSYIFSHMLICIVVSAFAFGTFMVLQGFFITVTDIPKGWRWVHYIAFHSYSFRNFMFNAFDKITIKSDNSVYPPVTQDYDGSIVLKQFDMDEEDIGLNFLILCIMAFLYRFFAFLWSYFRHNGKK